MHPLPPSHATGSGRRATATGFWLVFLLGLAWLLWLLVRLSADGAVAPAERYAQRQEDVRRLEQAVRALRARQGEVVVRFSANFDESYDRLQAAGAMACGSAEGAAAVQARKDALARLSQAHTALRSPQLRSPEVLDRFETQLLEVDRAARACMKTELADAMALARRLRNEAFGVLGLMALAAVALAWLRRGELARAREQLQFKDQLIDAIPVPVSMRSPQGDFLMVNRSFEQRLGVNREEVVGRPVGQALIPESAEAILNLDAQAMLGAGPVSGSIQTATPEGPRHIQARVQAVRAPDGAVIATVGVHNDVTALVLKEAQLAESNARLGQLSMRMVAAQEQERQRIAAGLYDPVEQTLTALRQQLNGLAGHERIEQPATTIAGPVGLVDDALRQTRALSASLYPPLLDDLGLEPTLHWLVAGIVRPSLAHIDLNCRLHPPRGKAPVELAAFRMVQEALGNVLSHAWANRATVTLEAAGGRLTVEVLDDGVGFEAGPDWLSLQRSTSLGMALMRDRVLQVGGEFSVISKPGSGTRVRAQLPW